MRLSLSDRSVPGIRAAWDALSFLLMAHHSHSPSSSDGDRDPTEVAAEWFVRRETGESWTDRDEGAFQLWCEADARHRQEYEILRALHGQAAFAEPPAPASRDGSFPRCRDCLALLGVASVVALFVVLCWRLVAPPPFAETFSTTVGEIAEVALPEDSVLHLDTRTRIDAHFTRDQRLILLREGRAVFAVSSDPDRPFIVRTPSGDVTVVGTQFEVDLQGDATALTVREGRVRFQPVKGAPEHRLLTAGEQVVFHATGADGDVRTVDLAHFGSWREGRLVFEDRPLVEVAREVGRYLGKEVQVKSEDLRLAPISGVFDLGDLPEFFAAVEEMLPVQVRYESADRVVIEPAS